MNQIMTQSIQNDIIYYGVYSTSDDMWNGSDVLCAARKRFFETGENQKSRSTLKTDDATINYQYTMELGKPLKYKTIKSGRSYERVAEQAEGYCIETLGDRRVPVKKVYYHRDHRWMKTEYLSQTDHRVVLQLEPTTINDKPGILFKNAVKQDTLIPFDVNLDKELTQRLNILTSEPTVFCVTSYGSFYYCTQEEYDARRKMLDSLLQESTTVVEAAPKEPLQSEFVINTQAIIPQETGAFDLKQSPSIRVTEVSVAEEFTAEQQKEPDRIPDAETVAVTSADASVPEKNAVKEEASTPKAKRLSSKKSTAKTAKESASADKPKTRSRKSAKTPEKTVALGGESAEPIADSIFGGDKGVIPVPRENICSFVHDCPYETMDKQIIEADGKTYYYFGDLAANQRSGRGRTAMKNGETAYEGEYLDDKRDGFGVYYYHSGKLCYAGEWKQNERAGLGVAFSPTDGSLFAGCWQQDEAVGVGSHYDRSGRMLYTGIMENGKRSGAGITFNEEDETYFIGKYRDGEFLETGTQFSRQGDLLYTGGYRANARHGQGTSYRADGTVEYKGEWLSNQFHGAGIFYQEDGSTVSGSFKNGKPHGKCTLTDAAGKVLYEGGYIDEAYNGTGRLFLENGGYAEGRFVDGEPTGIFNEYNQAEELVYSGEWNQKGRNGRGILYEAGKKRYEGDFRGSLYHGEGKLYQNDCVIYSGSFTEGLQDGFGVEYIDNRQHYKGLWRGGLYNGFGILYRDGEPAFVGQFADGKMHGRINELQDRVLVRKSLYHEGELTYAWEFAHDGSLLYNGYIHDGRRSGMGCSFGSYTEKQFEGIFRNNEPEKAMKVLLKELEELPPCPELDHTEYELYRQTPEWLIEKQILVGNSTGIYSGRLKNGLPDGSGTILYSDHRFTGQFSEGHPDGEGIVYTHDGAVHKGMYYDKPFTGCKTMVLSDITYYYR